MKTLFTAVTILVLASAAQAEDWPPADTYFSRISAKCSDDADWCAKAEAVWTKDYEKATRGDYQGQRNVSFCLSTGCTEFYNQSIRPNPILGCAWRYVILESGHLSVDDTDTQNLKVFCGPQYLDKAGLSAAEAQANRLLKMLGQ